MGKINFNQQEIKDIIKLYTIDGLTSAKIGKKYNCSFGPIERILKENNIEIKRKNKIKYAAGDIVGNNFTLIERLRPINNGKGYLCKFKCPLCGKIFEADLYNITSKSTKYVSCGCYRKQYVCFQPDYSLIGQIFGNLKVLEDDGTRVDSPNSSDRGNVKWKCICTCGRITHVTGEHLKSGHTTSCGQCCCSKGENKIVNILEELKIKYESQKTFKDCVNPKTNRKLRFDFYLPSYNCCIEYDGEQHFHIPQNKKSTYFTSEQIEQIKYRDNIKNQYCKKQNIPLIRIPYTEYKYINKDYLLNLIQNNVRLGSTGE